MQSVRYVFAPIDSLPTARARAKSFGQRTLSPFFERMVGAPPPRSGPSARSQKRLRTDVCGGDARFQRRIEALYPEPPGLEIWFELSGRLVANDILPSRLRDVNLQHVSTNEVEMRALIGDKIFGAALLEELVLTGLVQGTGEATRQYSLVASNASMAQFVAEVLPLHVEGGREAEEHSAGTLIEAAVYMVNQMPGGQQAIKQLARWFVYNVVVRGRKQGTIANPKGLILELNGKTMSERIPGTPDHAPEFAARCIWPAQNPIHETKAIGRSKTTAEAAAAKEMLDIFGHDIYNAEPQEPAKLREKKDARLANAYGELLTLGGFLVGGDAVLVSAPGETPRFVATMRYGREETRAEGPTKSIAKRDASRQLLELIGEYDD